MTFADIPVGEEVFLDANPIIEHFASNLFNGPACTALLMRIANQEIRASTSVHVLGEVAHRLLTIEACATFRWPYKGIAQRLATHPDEVKKLAKYRLALEEIPLFGIQVFPVSSHLVSLAIELTSQHGLLFNDAMVVAMLREHGITSLASNDDDFDRVPGITRYSPR